MRPCTTTHYPPPLPTTTTHHYLPLSLVVVTAYPREACTVTEEPLRRLPWTEDGRPAFLSGNDGPVSRLADEVEAQQVEAAAVVLALAREMLASGRMTLPEATWVNRRLTECLRDALDVAESRGARLGL
jgi:hypothetical protein